MRNKAALTASMFALVALAGCSDGGAGGGDGVIDRADFDLQAGKGAIAGLLVDDRFRPIHLTDDPTSQYQAEGFVLLQETGQQVQTNENGEFTFVDIEPGTYQVRVSASGHEATPQTVQVQDGVFAEQTIIARRTVSVGGTVVTQEFSAFVPCAVAFVANGLVGDCIGDRSGDSYRAGFSVNYTGTANVTYLIVEARISQMGDWNVQLRENDGSTAGGDRYGVADITDGDYTKITLERGVVNTEHNDQNNNVAWHNNETNPLHTIFFMNENKQDIQDAWPENPGAPVWYTPCCGLGAKFGMQAKFMHSLFLDEPEADLAEYCVLC